MKKKSIALLLAALMAMSGSAQCAMAMETDFSDGVQSVQEETQASEPEAAEDEQETEPETAEETQAEASDSIDESVTEVSEAEDIVDAEETEEESAESDVIDAEQAVSAGEDTLFGDGLTDAAVSADDTEADNQYVVGYVSKEQYENCLAGGDMPEIKEISGEGTLTEALNALLASGGENTGYCVLLSNNPQGYEDLVVPEGLNVFVAYGNHMSLRSITANGNIVIWEEIETPGTLEIKKGSGRVGFYHNAVHGKIVGSGSGNSVEIYDYMAADDGMTGVENIYLACSSSEFNQVNINTSGLLEFYNLYCDGKSMKGEEGSTVLWLSIEGYSADHIPVFHKSFDFGSNTFTNNDDGSTWDGNYGIGINYFDKFEGEDWPQTNIGAGKQAVKFEGMSDGDILDLVTRISYNDSEKGYSLDLNGCTFDSDDGSTLYHVQRFVDCDTQTAAEAFDADWKSEWDYDKSLEWIYDMPDASQAARVVAADQKKGNSGYYRVELPKTDVINEALTVPDGVSGVQYSTYRDYDKEADKDILYPFKLSAMSVPAGSKMIMIGAEVETDKLNISGTGTVEFRGSTITADTVTSSGTLLLFGDNMITADTVTSSGTILLNGNNKLNADVTADTLTVVKDGGAVVKRLTCKNLTMPDEYNRFVVSEYLKFDKASLNATVVYALPGACLNFGEIDNTSLGNMNDGVEVFLGTENGSRAQIYFGGKLSLGTCAYDYTDDDGTRHQGTYTPVVALYSCDFAAARAKGICFTNDCFTTDYQYDWSDSDDTYGSNFKTEYSGAADCIATFSSALDAKELLSHISYVAENGGQTVELSPRAVYYQEEWTNGELDEGIDGNKYLTFYMTGENYDKIVKAAAYYQTGTAKDPTVNISGAKISAISSQIYAGKAVTPSVTVTLNGKTLTKDTDYTVSYANNEKAGATATVTITGKGNYSGTVSASFKITAVPAKNKTATVGSLKYKVTKSDYKNGTVTVYAPSKKTVTSVKIPSAVKIGGYTFKVTAVSAKAFNGCKKLAKVTIGKNVTTIGKQAFNGCKSLKTITIQSKSLKKVGSNALKGISSSAKIKVPASKLSAYKTLLKGKGQKSGVKITK